MDGARIDAEAAQGGSATTIQTVPPEIARWDELQKYYREYATGSPLDLDAHILGAYGAHCEWMDDADLWQTEASPLWQFLRVCKAHPELHDAKPKAAAKAIGRVIADWANGRTIVDRQAAAWDKYFALDVEAAIAEIVETWPKIKRPYGAGALDEALQRAHQCPIDFADGAMLTLDTPGYRHFLSVAGWMQITVDAGQPILLPIDTLAKRLPRQPNRKTVSRWRKFGVGDRFLRVTAKHIPGRVASRFLFDVRSVPMLREVASPETIAVLEETDGGDA